MQVARQVTGITGQIFMGTKLGRIDKDTGDENRILCTSLTDQRKMSLMQITHRWHKANRWCVCPVCSRLKHLLNSSNNAHGFIAFPFCIALPVSVVVQANQKQASRKPDTRSSISPPASSTQ